MRIPLAMVLLCAAPALAQTDNKLYFPAVLANQEGDRANTVIFGQSGYCRWQQIDTDTTTNSHIVQFLRLRRDGRLAASGAGSRTVDIELQMGLGQASSFGNDFQANYLPGFSTVVFPRAPVSLPDWSQTPGCEPAPFDLSISAGFWSYNGLLPLVWDIQVWSSTAPGHPVDATDGVGTFVSNHCRLGTGCNGFTDLTSYDVSGWGSASALTLAARSAPASTAVTFLIGTMDPNLALPGLCAKVRTDGALVASGGLSSAAGDVSSTLPFGGYPLVFGGFQFYSQAVALSGPGSLALSSGSQVTLPLVPLRPYTIKHVYTTVQGSPTGQGPFDGGVVVQIDDGVP